MQEKDNSGLFWFLGLGALSALVYFATRSEPKAKVVAYEMTKVDTSGNPSVPGGRPPGAAPGAEPLRVVPVPTQ